MKTVAAAPGPRSAQPAASRGQAAMPAVGEAARIHEAARMGIRSGGGTLPYLDRIQRSFGAHDISGVRVHTGPEAAAGARAMGASAYTYGNHVAFAGAPSLHVAAHEAAHVLQQRAGVRVPDGVGREGDAYEQQAERVAGAVVRGESAEALLGSPGGGGGSSASVQRYFSPDDLTDVAGNLPGDARISENGRLIWMGKQKLVAAEPNFEASNELLSKKSKVLLAKGDPVDIRLEMPEDEEGFQTLLIDDYYEVRPRLNPKFVDEKAYESALSPTMDDDEEAIAEKHRQYMAGLEKVESDLAAFIKEIDDSWYFPSKDSVAEANRWVQKDRMREDLLMSHIALAFFPYQNEHKSTKILLTQLRSLQERLHTFVEGEADREDSIILPNDCAQCVSELVGDQKSRSRVDDLYHAPKIGSNYYTSLPAPKHSSLGWNFHWAGVVMADGGDRATLETAGGLSFSGKDKATWWFNLYGTKVADQTFKKQIYRTHLERNLHELAKSPKGIKDKIDMQDIQEQLFGLDDKFE